MRYELTDDFIKIAESSGTIVNISNARVEISEKQEARSGIILYPRKEYSFEDITLYARREAGDSSPAAIAVGPLASGGSGSGTSDDDFATDESVDDMLGSIFGDD